MLRWICKVQADDFMNCLLVLLCSFRKQVQGGTVPTCFFFVSQANGTEIKHWAQRSRTKGTGKSCSTCSRTEKKWRMEQTLSYWIKKWQHIESVLLKYLPEIFLNVFFLTITSFGKLFYTFIYYIYTFAMQMKIPFMTNLFSAMYMTYNWKPHG